MGGGVLGLDTLGNFVLGSLSSTGEAVSHEGSISATIGVASISAAIEAGIISAAVSVGTISASITIDEEG